MLRRWAGPLVTALIVVGVALVVVLNLDLKGSSSSGPPASVVPKAPAPGVGKPAGFREYPIGDPVERSRMRISAVWLPPIEMDGMAGPADSDVIHLEADVRATEGNPNGFAKDEFVPYLKVGYTIAPTAGGAPIHRGQLMPMVAIDGLHYGASVAMPRAGSYRLTYEFTPPSADLGRHSDPASGVAPWWEPFQVSFDWDYPGPPGAPAAAKPD